MKALLNLKSLMFTMLAALFLTFWAPAKTEVPGEWPQWRGARRDGISTETGLLKQWPADGPAQLWKTNGLGNGYSTVSITKGRIFTMGLKGNREFVIALDAADGKPAWVQAHGGRFSNNRGDGPRGTPTVDGDRLYALGGNGDLSCLETATGKIVWTQNIFDKFGGSNINWGISESPLILGDQLLVNAGGPNASIVSLNKKDGSLIWKTGSDQAGYSSAIPFEVGGVPQAVFFTHHRALAVDVRNGNLLWDYSQVANRTANVATPIVKGNKVFLSSDYGTGCALLEIKPEGTKASSSGNLLQPEHEEPSQLVGADWRYVVRLLKRRSHGHAVRQRRGDLEGSQRRQGLSGVRRRSFVLLQRKRSGRPGRSNTERLPGKGPLQHSPGVSAYVEPPRGRGRETLPSGSG